MADKPQLSRISFSGKIHLIETNQQLAAIERELTSANELGFDTETKPAFKVGEVFKVALLQLSTETDAYVIRLHPITEFAPLIRVLEDKNILKVGVAIRDDLKTLKKTFPFQEQNFVELQLVAKEKGLQNFGLKGMTEEVLHSSLSKRAKMSNWESPKLTQDQLLYAATDAWIGLHLYHTIKDRPAPISSFSHVALLVSSVEKSAEFLRTQGVRTGEVETFDSEGTKEVYVGSYGSQRGLLLLLEAISKGAYQRALEKRGPSLHHLAIDVLNVEKFLPMAEKAGWQIHPITEKTLSHHTAWLFCKGIPALIEVHQRKELSSKSPKVSKIEMPIQREQISLFEAIGLGNTVSAGEKLRVTVDGKSWSFDEILGGG